LVPPRQRSQSRARANEDPKENKENPTTPRTIIPRGLNLLRVPKKTPTKTGGSRLMLSSGHPDKRLPNRKDLPSSHIGITSRNAGPSGPFMESTTKQEHYFKVGREAGLEEELIEELWTIRKAREEAKEMTEGYCVICGDGYYRYSGRAPVCNEPDCMRRYRSINSLKSYHKNKREAKSE